MNRRRNPFPILFLLIGGICCLIFAPAADKTEQGTILGIGVILLWFLSTVIVPALWGDALCKRFGEKWGMIIAYAPLWLPLLLALTAGLCASLSGRRF
jgi:hypothetical protein